MANQNEIEKLVYANDFGEKYPCLAKADLDRIIETVKKSIEIEGWSLTPRVALFHLELDLKSGRLTLAELNEKPKELYIPTDDEIFIAITPDAYPTLAKYSQQMIVPAVKSLMSSEQASLDTVLMNLEMDLVEREQMS